MSSNVIFTIYALSLQRQWRSIIQQECYGCEFNRCSQLDHDVCCMMESEQQLSMYFNTAMNNTNDDDIIEEIVSLTTLEKSEAQSLLSLVKSDESALKLFLVKHLM